MSEKEIKNLEEIFEQRIANDEKIEPKDWMPSASGIIPAPKTISMPAAMGISITPWRPISWPG